VSTQRGLDECFAVAMVLYLIPTRGTGGGSISPFERGHGWLNGASNCEAMATVCLRVLNPEVARQAACIGRACLSARAIGEMFESSDSLAMGVRSIFGGMVGSVIQSTSRPPWAQPSHFLAKSITLEDPVEYGD